MHKFKSLRYAAALTAAITLIGSAALSSPVLLSAEETEYEITLGLPADPDAEEKSIKEVAAMVMPCMAAITSTSVEEVRSYFNGFGFGFGFEDFYGDYPRSYENVSKGTGVIIGMTGDYILIATNEHVVEGADSLSASFIDEAAAEATVIGRDKTNDLAVLKVAKEELTEETLNAIRVVTLGTSEGLMVGEEVVAIGNALGYGQSVSAGIVSALNRSLSSITGSPDSDTSGGMIQTDASINPGNSGGALLNRKGELIGINSAKYADTKVEGMGYAIPVDTALPILTKIANRLNGSAAGSQVSLGITASTDITDDLADYYGIPKGVYINTLEAGSAADLAGICAGDIITAVDGDKVLTLEELEEVLLNYEPGDSAEVSLSRISSNSPYGRRLRSGTVTVTFSELEFGALDAPSSAA